MTTNHDSTKTDIIGVGWNDSLGRQYCDDIHIETLKDEVVIYINNVHVATLTATPNHPKDILANLL